MWEAPTKAIAAITYSYSDVCKKPMLYSFNVIEGGVIKQLAGTLQEKILELEFVFMLQFWTHLFDQFYKVNKSANFTVYML